MGSKGSVYTYTSRAKSASRAEDKLNALADAIYALADFVDDLENQLRRIEQKIR
jgi:hypothetical protein